MELEVNGRKLRLRRGDITESSTEAIVNAANSALAGGGGVDGAIHRAGGPSIMEECRRIGGCPTGSAVATAAGNLAARHVIHAVAPVWRGGDQGEAELLESAYRRSLEVADELGDRTVEFPSLGTGAYGYPIDEASAIAVGTVLEYLSGATGIQEVEFVLFSASDLETYKQALTTKI
jgi:O-acetyl-ADP-ribose deacetylase (regulator of RNase III)